MSHVFKSKLFFGALGRMALALACATTLAAPALAQSNTLALVIPKDACDSDNYPSVTCVVSVLNGAGVPLRDIPASSWEVGDAAQPAKDVKVEQFEDAKVSASYMAVVDFGMTQRGQIQLPALRDAARSIFQAAGDGDRVGVVAITGKVDNVDGSKLDPTKEASLVDAGTKRNEIINLITQLSPVSGTPLYDGICKAVAVLDRDTTPGTRALIVLSDGNDARSTVCDANAAITRARDKRIPVFTIGVGASVDARFLQLIALQTDGQYLAEPKIQAVQDRFKQVQALLRTRYKVSFTAASPSDGAAHTATIKVRAQNNTLTGDAAYSALLPRKPAIEKLAFKDGGVMVDGKNLPFGKAITLEPEIKVRDGKLARMEYQIDEQNPVSVQQPPYAFTLPANLAAGAHKVIMTAVADPNRPELNTTTPALEFIIAPQPQISPTPTVTPSCKIVKIGDVCVDSPAPLVGVGVAVLGALGLALMLVLRKRKKQDVDYTVVATPPDSDSSPYESSYNSAIVTSMNSGEGSTQVMSDSTQVFTGGMTQIMPAVTQVFQPPKFMLVITSGAESGKEFPIGLAGKEAQVGREVDAVTGVRLSSTFVSRNHARMYVEGDDVFLIEDRKSSSGTRVNGVRLETAKAVQLKENDQVEFADVHAVIRKP